MYSPEQKHISDQQQYEKIADVLGKYPDLRDAFFDNTLKITEGVPEHNPILAKAILIQSLKNTTYGAQAWKTLVHNGVCHFENLHFDQTTRVANNKAGIITLGTHEIPPEVKDAMIFYDSMFDYHDTMVWKLLHEMSHSILYKMHLQDKQLLALFKTIKDVREKTERGLTLIGTLDFYKHHGGAREQATEDITECINMYLRDPVHFDKVLDLLIKADQNFLDTYQLVRLNDETKKLISETITQSIQDFLDT